MNVKLICTDIDGTLFGDGHVPEKNLRALHACAARGIRVALVSGRNNGFLCRLSREMGIPCAIASANGSRIEASPDGPCVQERTFGAERGQWLFDTLYALDVNFEVYISVATVYASRAVTRPISMYTAPQVSSIAS